MHPAALTVLLHRALEARIGRLLELTAGDAWRQDPAGLHDARVASRRVRAVMELVDPALYPRFKHHLRRIKGLTRTLGAPREGDVHLEILESLKAQPLEAASLAALEFAQEALDRSCRRARRRMERGLTKSSLAGFSKLLRAPSLDFPIGPDDARDAAWVRLAPRLRAMGEPLPDLMGQEDTAALHAQRIRAKKLRYTLEVLAPAFEGETGPALEALRELQTVLGEHHDLATLEASLRILQEQLAERHRPTLSAGLLELLEFLAGQRRAAFDRFCGMGPAYASASFLAGLRPEASR